MSPTGMVIALEHPPLGYRKLGLFVASHLLSCGRFLC